MDGAVSLFVLLELLNACQSFALQTSLSGGTDDTPLDLVRNTAYQRTYRCFIDAGTLVLRLILWIQYNATNGVFLVKNLYNLMHTAALMERW